MQVIIIEIMMVTLGLGLSNVDCATEQGPYEAIVSNISSCVAVQPSWYHTNISIYRSDGRNFLRVKFVTKQNFKDPRFRVRLNYTDQSMQVKAYEIKNQNCHNFIFKAVMRSIGLQNKSQKCLLTPISYEVSKVDVNTILHTFVQYMWYGSVEIHFEIWKTTTLLMCIDVNVQIQKLEQ